jgi:hypothetical protein
MRVSVGLFLVLGLIAAGCQKKEATSEDSQQLENGVVLGDGRPAAAAVPTPGVVTPTKVVQPARPAFGAIGTPVGAAGNVPAQPVATQAPPASPVAKQATPAAPAATPTPPVAPVAQANAVAATPTAGGAGVSGRGVPPPPGGRPKPGTK